LNWFEIEADSHLIGDPNPVIVDISPPVGLYCLPFL
jgi:hypothetical protein